MPDRHLKICSQRRLSFTLVYLSFSTPAGTVMFLYYDFDFVNDSNWVKFSGNRTSCTLKMLSCQAVQAWGGMFTHNDDCLLHLLSTFPGI